MWNYEIGTVVKIRGTAIDVENQVCFWPQLMHKLKGCTHLRTGGFNPLEGIETAGPEMSTSLQFVHQLGPKTNLILDINGGAAYFHYGPNLIVPQSQLFPFFEFSAGFGW